MTDLVIITGASRGLGRALAENVPFPAHVVDISRTAPSDGPIEHLRADLSDPAEWPRVGDAVESMIELHSPSRCVLIHSAGVLTPIGFAGEVDATAYTSNVLLNSASGQVLGHRFLRAISGRDGRFELIMISSGAAKREYPGWSSYGAAKAALDHWVRIVGKEQAERGGVQVAAIAPGVVATEMQGEIRQADERDFPEVQRFHDIHDEGDLAEPGAAATKIWAVIEAGFEPGAVIDIRNTG